MNNSDIQLKQHEQSGKYIWDQKLTDWIKFRNINKVGQMLKKKARLQWMDFYAICLIHDTQRMNCFCELQKCDLELSAIITC